MINELIGFLWGIVCAFIIFDYLSDDINIYWWAWAIIVLFIFFTKLCIKLNHFIKENL